MSVFYFSERVISRRFRGNSTALQVLDGVDFTGKTVLITGCNTGIGYETARVLCLKNAHIVMACRNTEATEKAKKQILTEKADGQLDIIQCDLASLASIKLAVDSFMEKQWPLHILILNAGVMDSSIPKTMDGYETTFGVNHLGHFYLTTLLLPKLRECPLSRVVVLSSLSHTHTGLPEGRSVDYYLEHLLSSEDSSYKRYARSKLCNVLFAFCLDRKEPGIQVNALHPGLISTEFFRNSCLFKLGVCLLKPCLKSQHQGASTSVFCAAAPELRGVGGRYFSDCWFTDVSPLAKNIQLQDKLWEASEKMIQKFENTIFK